MIFDGAKLALFLGEDLLVIRRDDHAGIAYPDFLDLPGGGREGEETAIECVLRETREEVGLILPPDQIVWSRDYFSDNGTRVFFFAMHRPAAERDRIVFGNEGQYWRLMKPETYATHPEAVPYLARQVGVYLSEAGLSL